MQENETSPPSSPRENGTSITVVVRVRPPNQNEKNGPQGELIKIVDDKFLIFDPPGGRPDKQRQTFIGSARSRAKDISFGFDKIFGEESTQEDVFDVIKNTIFPEKGGLLDGFNCTVFAYGATGSGKTFSMAGTPEQPGIMSRSVEHIFQSIQLQTGRKAKLRMSYLEIYNENIRDLLKPSDPKQKELKIVDDPENGITVTNLSHCYPKDTKEVLELVQLGNNNRTQAPTEANPVSSRSHAILQIIVENYDDVPGTKTTSQIGKLSLIDLAGSERATQNTGVRLRETTKINCSLLALGNCITALCSGSPHIPFRQSKLTRLLMDSLGGNCKTICLSCVSPSYLTMDDTYNTLQYANKAKKIKTNIKKNTVNVKAHVAEYQAMIEKLRDQVLDLQCRAVNMPLLNQYRRTCDEAMQVQKHKIDSIISKARPVSSLDLQSKFAFYQDKTGEIRKKCKTRCNAFIQEACKARPDDESQKKWLENEQRVHSLTLENYALNAACDIFQEQINIQNQLINELLKGRRSDAIRSRESEDEQEEIKDADESDDEITIKRIPLDSIKMLDIDDDLSDDEDDEKQSIRTQDTTPSVRDVIEDDVPEKYQTLQPHQQSRPFTARKKPEPRVSISDMSRIVKQQPLSIRERFEAIKKSQQRKPLSQRPENQYENSSDFNSVLNRLKSRISGAGQRKETPSSILLDRRRAQFRL